MRPWNMHRRREVSKSRVQIVIAARLHKQLEPSAGIVLVGLLLLFTGSFISLGGGFSVASNQNNTGISRRDFGKGLASVAAASALAGIAIPTVHAAVSTTVQVALVGCGG